MDLHVVTWSSPKRHPSHKGSSCKTRNDDGDEQHGDEMLPLSLLNAAKGKPILVELKNGETFNGHLENCDAFMNLTLTEVYQTSNTGEQFWKLPECYIRGSTVKYCRVADALVDTVKEAEEEARKQRQAQGSLSGGVGLGTRGGRGGGGAGRGGPGQNNRGGQRGGGQRGGRGRGQQH